MCTVSLVPHRRGVRLVCNRDEQRTRSAALPPQIHRLEDVRAVWPADPASGGTWIGANDAGLAAVLLNRSTPGKPPRAPQQSRGTIIPPLLALRNLDDVAERARMLPPGVFEPFTLLVLFDEQLLVVSATAGAHRMRRRTVDVPLLFTSSSIGDRLVDGPRRRLFRRLVTAAASPLRGQAVFHRHFWPDRRDLSVWMRRPDAATVSRTVVNLGRGSVTMIYLPLPA